MSKIARKLGARFGLEDDTPEIGEAGDTPIEEETSAASAEVAEAAAEVTEADQGADKLEEIHEGLSDLAEKLEEAIAEDQPVSTEAAAYIRMHINHLVGKYGLTDDVMPSLESFGGSAGRRAATISLEKSVKEMLKSFWDMIMKQLNKVKAFVKNWYLKVLDAAPRLKKKAAAVSEKARKTTGAKDGNVVSIGQLRALHTNKKPIEPGKLVAAMEGISKFTKKAMGDTTAGQYEAVFKAYDEGIQEVAGNDKLTGSEAPGAVLKAPNSKSFAALSKSLDLIKNIPIGDLAGDAAPADATNNKRFGETADVSGSVVLPGGKFVVIGKGVQTPAADADYSAVKASRDIFARVENVSPKAVDIDSSADFKILSTGEVTAVCDSIETICDSIIAYKKAWEKREKSLADLDNAAKKAISAAEKESDSDENKQKAISLRARLVKDLANAMTTRWRTATTFDTSWINYCLSTSRAALVYCEASLGQYK